MTSLKTSARRKTVGKLRVPVSKFCMDAPLPHPFWEKAIEWPSAFVRVQNIKSPLERQITYNGLRFRKGSPGKRVTQLAQDPDTGRWVSYHATKGFRSNRFRRIA